jgi:transcriptional regulator with XRE-family HTH domain
MRELRQARGLSQAQVAELSGVSERTVRAIERGSVDRPQHESLRRIAAVLAYGEGHQRRLVDRWTGTGVGRTPDEIGMPDWQALYRRMSLRMHGDGGELSSLMVTTTIGPDRQRFRDSAVEVREPMTPAGSPVIWIASSEPTFDMSTVRFEVPVGGVIDDFFVHGDVAALAIRPDPAIAHHGPFVLETTRDYSEAAPTGRPPDNEHMFGIMTPLRLATLVVRFTGPPPERVWLVRGPTAAAAERVALVKVAADGTAQLCLQDFAGVFGLQWEWDDEAQPQVGPR